MSQPKNETNEPPNTPASVGAARPSGSRRWVFRLLAVLVIPVLLVAVPEIGLRVAGVGHSTSFFREASIGGRPVYIENADFGLRFFPPELARTPSPLVMPAVKPQGTYRIFVLGESAALGDPEPAFGVGRYLESLLRERYPGTQFEVINAAMTAINSHVLLPIAQDCVRRDGDLWVVYMGNNEFVGPFGPGTVFGKQVPSLGFIRTSVALKQLRLVQWLESVARKQEKEDPEKAAAWGGMKMFLDHQVTPNDPRKALVYEYYQRNLEDILDTAAKAGVRVVLSTVGSNLKDCAPFASTNSESLSGQAATDWQQAYAGGNTALSMRDYAGAAGQYKNAAKLDDSYAALHYRQGKCQLGMENRDEAQKEFEMARDRDSLPFRADTQLNKIVAEVGARRAGPGLAFVDGAAAMNFASPQGIAGREYFYEHVHLNFEGNYLLARTLAESVLKMLPTTISGTNPNGQWASFDTASRRLALNDWDRRRVYDSIGRRFVEPPFAGNADHTNQLEKIRRDFNTIRQRIKPEAARQVKQMYQELLKTNATDYYIAGNYAKFLEDIGDIEGAAAAWTQEQELLPFEAAPYLYLGKIQARQKKTDEALANLTHALEIRPDSAEALDEKGHILLDKRRLDEAKPLLVAALRLQPKNAHIWLHMADAAAASGDRAGALTCLMQAAGAQPGLWEPQYLLGVELAARDRIKEAKIHFAEAVRLRPDFALGRLNYGIALAKDGQVAEAIAQMNETVRLDPSNNKAVEYLKMLQR